ncbi:unnamed protein product [Clavelina lepadiformis]|uniref:Cilia- and flagella-associated protein 300 n=1 Tax=Clavelina lepadiformis TaxID=159417 RepID=A0ABP0H1P9_CLALP
MDESPFLFKQLQRSLPTLCNKQFKTYFEKWSLNESLQAWMFSFDQPFQHYMADKLIKNFFNDPDVLAAVQQNDASGCWTKLEPPKSIQFEELGTTVTSMNFFDKLTEEGIVRENGNICKCFDEFYEGIPISDELRKMLLVEDSENFECYNDSERNELLFKLFMHVVIGGSLCQYEDTIQPYFDVTKSLYKDIVSVLKHPETKELNVVSKAYQVSAQDGLDRTFYPSAEEHPQNFAYIVIDPIKRHVTLLHHSWGKGFW